MMKGGLGGLMKQAQKMQEEMQKAQSEVATIEVEGQSGGGLVTVLMNGQHELKRVAIDDSLLSDDKDMLEDLILTAINDANKQIADASAAKMQGATGGMKLPGGINLPF
jgi:DNA-binding YbaB/EbfC family protein